MMKSLEEEAPASVWNDLYSRDATPWRSAGLSDPARSLIKRYAPGDRFLEIGCGFGDDSDAVAEMGFEYHGLDMAKSAIHQAKTKHASELVHFTTADFFAWSAPDPFNIVYDKGLFHGLAGMQRRKSFLRRVAQSLSPQGVWITVCGSADHRRTDFSHGAIYLRDLIEPAEIFFEVLEVEKAKYNLRDGKHDFQAWHAAFRRR